MEKLVDICKKYACDKHAETNHFYDNEPYSFHLEMVYQYAKKYSYLIPSVYREYVLASAWPHDTIEDARQTFNDVAKVCGEFVAEITYALTNDKGKNRKERAGAKYYEGIRNTPYARFIKICDRLANARHSLDTRSGMLKKYRKELDEFKKELYSPEYEAMWIELESILSEITDYNTNFSINSEHSCLFSKSINQPSPRLCIICGKPEKPIINE